MAIDIMNIRKHRISVYRTPAKNLVSIINRKSWRGRNPEKKKAAEQYGVKVEISGYGKYAETNPKPALSAKSTEHTGQEQTIFSMIQDIFRTAVAAFKDFFDKIWNDPETEETLSETESFHSEAGGDESTIQVQDTEPETAESFYQKEDRLNQEIQPYLRKGDLNQVINLLTDNGKKTAARNSTLLTYYDRNGKMVEPSASDSQRILYGDRNTRKL